MLNALGSVLARCTDWRKLPRYSITRWTCSLIRFNQSSQVQDSGLRLVIRHVKTHKAKKSTEIEVHTAHIRNDVLLRRAEVQRLFRCLKRHQVTPWQTTMMHDPTSSVFIFRQIEDGGGRQFRFLLKLKTGREWHEGSPQGERWGCIRYGECDPTKQTPLDPRPEDFCRLNR